MLPRTVSWKDLRHIPFLPILNAVYYWSNNPVVLDWDAVAIGGHLTS
jgi:hypothetical protein